MSKVILLCLLFFVSCKPVEKPGYPRIVDKQAVVEIVPGLTTTTFSKNEPSTITPTLSTQPMIVSTPTFVPLSFVDRCEGDEEDLNHLFSQGNYRFFGKSIDNDQAKYWIVNTNDLKTKQEVTIPRLGSMLDVRADGNRVAYVTYNEVENKNELSVTDVDGDILFRKTDFPESFSFASWLDDQTLIFWHNIFDQKSEITVHRPVEVFNPFTRISREILLFPENLVGNLFWFGPGAEKGLFIQENGQEFWVLFDFESLEQYHLLLYRGGGSAAWSPDGEQVAISVGAIVVFDVSERKESYRIELTPSNLDTYSTENVTWDSTGNLISFWVNSNKEGTTVPQAGLYVFNVQQQVLHHYCLPERPPNGRFYWSPDSKFLGWTIGEGDPVDIYFLEIQTGRTAIWEGMRLLEWIE